MISRFGFSQARCSGVLPAWEGEYLRGEAPTFVVLEVLAGPEVEVVVGQHAENFELVVGCGHVGSGIEG
jgi:hypothetical protein